MRPAALVLATMTFVLLLASGVALAVTKIGGPGPDVLKGTDNRDRLEGGGGPDLILGLGAGDCLSGGTGSDTVECGPGDDLLVTGGPGGCVSPLGQERPGESDVLNGGPGDDIVEGAAGADTVRGGTGADLVADGENHRGATDVLYGGGGGDFMLPRNEPGGGDAVSCGSSGCDRVFADRKDEISGDCERVRYRSLTLVEVNAFISGG
jgi:Ca2+-binding RTX toxin-like protein